MADIKQIAEKIEGAKNILVALSKNPDVDEVSAALGLTLMLDKLGKKATAIYSGETPAMLKFLSPEKTFSTDTNALQDFIIALDKEKADHLRYKVDGDFVKVFITPYHEAITENDLEYSYGEFNVDLIVALDVADERDLDGALVEYGRIMHDAGVVNITNREGGKFSEMEWSNPEASSVSEMVAELGAEISPEAFEKNSATALLTGIVTATERFANEKTKPETMGVAAKLMAAGANQRLIAENIERAKNGEAQEPFSEETSSSEDELLTRGMSNTARSDAPSSSNSLSENDSEAEKVEPETETVEAEPESEPELEPEPESKPEPESEPEPEKPVLETPSELVEEPKEEAPEENPVEEPKEDLPVEEPKPEEAPVEEPKVELKGAAAEQGTEDTRRKSVTLQPSAEAQEELEKIMKEEPKKNELLDEINKYTGDQAVSGGLRPDVGLSSIDTDNIGKRETKDYSEMMAEALNGDDGLPNPAVQAAPEVATGPEANHIPEIDYSQASSAEAEQPPAMQNGMLESVSTAPASSDAPATPAMTEPSNPAPEAGGAAEDILPPPPAPPVDGAMMPPGAEMNNEASAMPATPVTPVTPAEPASQSGPVPVQPVIPVVPVAPQTTQAPSEPAPSAEAPQQVGPAPTNDDPAAFRIPM